jgi:hypothetical protein
MSQKDTLRESRQDLLHTMVDLKTRDQAPDLRKSINVFTQTDVPNPFLQNNQAEHATQNAQPQQLKDCPAGTNESSTQEK